MASKVRLPLLLPGLALLAAVLSLRAPGAAASTSPGLVFHVGGPRGWRVPDASTSYGWWAMNNRFHVGDELYFKYSNDSVLVVHRAAFDACNATEPVAAFTDGSTTFRLDRPGFFCFISGEPGHCEEGQRLVVRVMVHPAASALGPAAEGPVAAAPRTPDHRGSGGGGRPWQPGPPGASSGSAATVAAASGVAVAATAVALVSLLLMFQ